MKVILLIWQFIFNFLYLIDLAGNFILLGDPSETISSRTGRALRSGRPRWFVPYLGAFIDKIFNVLFGQKDHSINYIEHDENFEHEIWSWIKDEQ